MSSFSSSHIPSLYSSSSRWRCPSWQNTSPWKLFVCGPVERSSWSWLIPCQWGEREGGRGKGGEGRGEKDRGGEGRWRRKEREREGGGGKGREREGGNISKCWMSWGKTKIETSSCQTHCWLMFYQLAMMTPSSSVSSSEPTERLSRLSPQDEEHNQEGKKTKRWRGEKAGEMTV